MTVLVATIGGVFVMLPLAVRVHPLASVTVTV
jgi:hypothetical protein